MCFWDLLWVGNMKLSQSIQKCMFEILTIETPYEIIAISAIFEQGLLLKKKVTRKQLKMRQNPCV